MDKKIKFRITISLFFEILIFVLAFLLIVPLFLILFMIVKNGISVIDWKFLLYTPKAIGSSVPSGILNTIVGTLLLVLIAVLIAVPVGVLTGIYLSENNKSKLSNLIRAFIDILQSIPSIVIGLIGYLWIVLPMKNIGFSFSAFAGGFALALMILPIVIKSSDETLKLVPYSLKESAIALGASYYRTILFVTLPAAFNGILTGVMLGVSRIAGETAPLLFTAFGSNKLHANILKPIGSIPLLIYNYATSPFQEWIDMAWGASFVLVTIVFALNLTSKLMERR